MEPVKVKGFETWNMSVSFLFGVTPKVTMICGECSYVFSKRFRQIDFQYLRKYPQAICPACSVTDYVPLTVG